MRQQQMLRASLVTVHRDGRVDVVAGGQTYSNVEPEYDEFSDTRTVMVTDGYGDPIQLIWFEDDEDMDEYDSELEAEGLRLVIKHNNKVQRHMAAVISILLSRMADHDQSKLSDEELGLVLGKPTFDKFEYMSKEERAALEAVKESLVHHYANNSHHPEHYETGIDGMSLLDLLEMTCDWKAAGEMSANGSFQGSIDYNIKRFNLPPELVKILENTGREMGWIE